MERLILILGDQLSFEMNSLKNFDPKVDKVLMAEVKSEATYVKHHKKKLAFVFSAMRQLSWGVGAAAVTYIVGSLIGVSTG